MFSLIPLKINVSLVSIYARYWLLLLKGSDRVCDVNVLRPSIAK